MSAPRYADALAEARAEYEAWLARPSLIVLPLGYHGEGVVWSKEGNPGARALRCECGERAVRAGRCEKCRTAERSATKPPCECGRPYFARGMCRRCYTRWYRALNPRPSSAVGRPAVHTKPCACGGLHHAGGLCKVCYNRARRALARAG